MFILTFSYVTILMSKYSNIVLLANLIPMLVWYEMLSFISFYNFAIWSLYVSIDMCRNDETP